MEWLNKAFKPKIKVTANVKLSVQAFQSSVLEMGGWSAFGDFFVCSEDSEH
jgi:hypothetical protein